MVLELQRLQVKSVSFGTSRSTQAIAICGPTSATFSCLQRSSKLRAYWGGRMTPSFQRVSNSLPLRRVPVRGGVFAHALVSAKVAYGVPYSLRQRPSYSVPRDHVAEGPRDLCTTKPRERFSLSLCGAAGYRPVRQLSICLLRALNSAEWPAYWVPSLSKVCWTASKTLFLEY